MVYVPVSRTTARMHVDLTHAIRSGMQTYPGDPAVAVSDHSSHETDGYRVSAVELGSHAGTHVDAPAHVIPGGRTLDAYPPDRFVFDAVRVDCRDLGPREPVPPARVPEVDGDCLVLWTGWDEHWDTDRYLDHPYLSPGAARRCAEQDLAVASDTLNPDPTPTESATGDEPEGFVAHHELLERDCLVVENLTNLGAVSDRFELRAYPIALGGDGAPVRAVGVV